MISKRFQHIFNFLNEQLQMHLVSMVSVQMTHCAVYKKMIILLRLR